MGRTDTHQLTVAHPDGRRHSFAGTLKECKAEAERLAGLWGKKAVADIIKRA